MAVTCSVPQSLGIAVRAAEDELFTMNNTYPTDPVTLLIGDAADNPLRGETVGDTIANAEKMYALGIASQFAVFVGGEGSHFKSTDSDVEGRLACGGDLIGSDCWGPQYLYEVGSGSYSADDGSGKGEHEVPANTGLDVILGYSGYAHVIATGNSIYSIALNSGDKKMQLNGQNEQSWKRIVIGNNTDTSFYETKAAQSIKDSYKDHMYQTDDILDVNAYMETIKSRSKLIANNPATGTVSQVDDTVTFSYSGSDNPETVYFDLPEWNPAISHVVFDVPYGTYVVVNCPQSGTIDLGSTNTKNQIYTKYANKDIGKLDNGDHHNMYESSFILYNFPNAEQVDLRACFNGSILAPDALISGKPGANGGNPHLSGAFIAKSFEGSAEIGYRTFTGPATILGTTADYELDFQKLDIGGANTVKGATIGAYSVDEDGNVSDKPAYIAKSGETDKLELAAGRYVIKEAKAPEGFQLDPKEYYIEVLPNGESSEIIEFPEVTTYNRTVYTLVSDELADADDTYISQSDVDGDPSYELITPEPYNFAQFCWRNGSDATLVFKKAVFNYIDGTSQEYEPTAGASPNADGSWTNIAFSGVNDQNILNVEFEIAGTGTGKIERQCHSGSEYANAETIEVPQILR